MKIVDYVVLALFAIGLIILCFMQQCSIDIYVLILGFVVLLISLGITLYQNLNSKKKKEKNN